MYAAQLVVVRTMVSWYPTVKVQVLWAPCGEENSFYDDGKVELCTEMEAHPDAALFFAAHETGHALAIQLAGTPDEQAADEIGALAMIRMDLRDELVGAAKYHGTKDPQGHWPDDPHPSNGYRFWELTCLEEGSGDGALGSEECKELYRSTKLRWDRRLGDAQVTPDEQMQLLMKMILGLPKNVVSE